MMLRFVLSLVGMMLIIAVGLILSLKLMGFLRAYEPLVYTTLDDNLEYSMRLHNLVTGRDVMLFRGEDLRISDVSPDGNIIYTETINDIPHMIVRNAHTLKVHFTVTDFDSPAIWSFAGTRLAYVDQNDGVFTLWILHLYEHTATAQHLPVLTSPFNMAWLADDEHLSYWAATTPTNYQLTMIHSQSGETDELFNWQARTQNTAWFPDGRYGLFGTVQATHRFDLTTGEITQLNDIQYDRNSLHIKQNGEHILYTTLTFGGRLVFLADHTGNLPQSIQLDENGLAVSVGWWQID